MNQLDPITNWYASLQAKERTMVAVMSVVIVLTLFYLLAWEPVYKGYEVERQKLESQKSILVWMKQAQQEVRNLRASGVKSTRRSSNTPVSIVIEQTAASSGLKSQVSKIESSGKNSSRVKLANVSFNQMILWINTIEQNHGIVTSSINIEKTDKPGLVNAKITFSKRE